MSRFFLLALLTFASVSFPLTANCQTSNTVAKPTDFVAEAAKRMKEKKDFQYAENVYKKTGDVAYTFKHPKNWSIAKDMQFPGMDVICMREEAVEKFKPNFNVIIAPKEDSDLMKMTESRFEEEMQKIIPDWKLLALERGKIKGKDVVFVHSQSTVVAKIEQFQYLFNENGKGVTLTFTSSRPIPDLVKEEFDAILATFELLAETAPKTE